MTKPPPIVLGKIVYSKVGDFEYQGVVTNISKMGFTRCLHLGSTIIYCNNNVLIWLDNKWQPLTKEML